MPYQYAPPTDLFKDEAARSRLAHSQQILLDLLRVMAPTGNMQAGFAGQIEPERQAAIMNALGLNNPETIKRLVADQSGEMLSNATMQGNRTAAMLGARGVSSSGQAGALVNSRNMAQMAGNQMRSQALSPAALLGMYQNQAGFLGEQQAPNLLPGLLNTAQGVYARPVRPKQKKGGLLDTVSQVAGIGSGLGLF